MFPTSWFPPNFFPPNYWPKTGRVRASAGGGVGRRRMWQEMEQHAKIVRQQQTYRSHIRSTIGSQTTITENERERMARAAATYTILLSEI